MSKGLKIALTVAVLAIVGIIVACSVAATTKSSGAPNSVATADVQAPVEPTHKGPATTFGGGQWEVGVDIAVGKYKSSGVTDGMCYWQITKTGTSEIIKNDIVQAGRPIVTLKNGQDFKSDGCGTWVKQ